jgi:uncharacterized membrane protein
MDERVRALAHELLESGVNHLTARERRAIEHIAKRRHITVDASKAYDETMGFGGRLADKVALWGGSWTFVIAFGVVLAIWAALNAWVLPDTDRFDPYPFIFLNLILSMLAAIQAPIIMMSQNRQAAKDRIEAAQDYDVNLKAELEVMTLHDKMDRLLKAQGIA